MGIREIKKYFYSQGYYKGLAPEPRFKRIVEIFSKLRGRTLLDVGCGDGSITLLLKESMGAQEVYGIEIAHEAAVAARNKGINVYELDVDGSNFPFEDSYFDVVYCGEIIEHLFDPSHLLNEVYRVLKKGGICVLTTPNLAGWPNRIALLLGYQPYSMAASPRYESVGKLLTKSPEGQWGHIRVMTLKALKDLVKLHGFKVKEVTGCTVSVKSNIPKVLLGLIKLMDKIMSKFPSLSTRIIMVIQKE